MLLRIADAVDVPLSRLLTNNRLTPDEKAWDAASHDLGERSTVVTPRGTPS
jgi:hypothetical protein